MGERWAEVRIKGRLMEVSLWCSHGKASLSGDCPTGFKDCKNCSHGVLLIPARMLQLLEEMKEWKYEHGGSGNSGRPRGETIGSEKTREDRSEKLVPGKRLRAYLE